MQMGIRNMGLQALLCLQCQLSFTWCDLFSSCCKFDQRHLLVTIQKHSDLFRIRIGFELLLAHIANETLRLGMAKVTQRVIRMQFECDEYDNRCTCDNSCTSNRFSVSLSFAVSSRTCDGTCRTCRIRAFCYHLLVA